MGLRVLREGREVDGKSSWEMIVSDAHGRSVIQDHVGCGLFGSFAGGGHDEVLLHILQPEHPARHPSNARHRTVSMSLCTLFGHCLLYY